MLVGLGILDFQEVLNLLRPVNGGALRADMGLAVALEWFGKHKEVGRTVALVSVVHPLWATGATGAVGSP